MQKSALIIGANGRLGRVLLDAFHAQGWQAIGQVLREPAAGARPGVRWLRAPLSEPQALADEAGRADVVVHAANPPYTRWARESLPLARGAIEAARRLGALLMFPGNVYNFGAGMPELLREDTPQHPTARKGRIRCEVEEALRESARAGLRVAVLRAGDFFGGPGRGAWFDLVMLKQLRAGRMVYPGRNDVLHAWAYLPDLAQAFVQVAQQPARLAPFEVLHFPGHTLTGGALASAVEAAAHRAGILAPTTKMRVGGMPWPLIRAGGLVVPMWREIAELRYLWSVPHRLSGERLAAIIGAVPQTPLEQALDAALRALFPHPPSDG
jgi:nucleoside-diphosphate-sugar epimerase